VQNFIRLAEDEEEGEFGSEITVVAEFKEPPTDEEIQAASDKMRKEYQIKNLQVFTQKLAPGEPCPHCQKCASRVAIGKYEVVE
jgi:hypothetical protein